MLSKNKRKRLVPKGWKIINLGKEFKTSSGATPLSSEKRFYENGTIPWINSGELASPYIYESSNYITQEGFDNSSTTMYPPNTVLVAMYGATAGKASLLKIEACTNQAICAIFPNDNYCPQFIKYSIDNLYDYLVGISSGSARDNLSQAELKDLELIVPQTRKEQEVLASTLSLLDKKIELNRQINDNLEAMAKQLYDYWFVQFDFPNEEGKPYKSSGGAMVWNEKLKREIPEGWNVANVFDELSVQYGFPFSTELFTEDPTSIPVVRIRDILVNSVSAYSEEEVDEKYKLQKQDLLVGMDGNFHMNYWNDNVAYLNQRSVRLRAKSKSTVSIMQAKYDIAPYIKAKELRAKGSTVGHLSDKDLKELFVLVCPNINFRNKFDSILAEIIENRCEMIELTKQRDELLPLLMNGQASVNYHLSDD